MKPGDKVRLNLFKCKYDLLDSFQRNVSRDLKTPGIVKANTSGIVNVDFGTKEIVFFEHELLLLEETNNPSIHSCEGNWIEYRGFTEDYRYCKVCDKKQN